MALLDGILVGGLLAGGRQQPQQSNSLSDILVMQAVLGNNNNSNSDYDKRIGMLENKMNTVENTLASQDKKLDYLVSQAQQRSKGNLPCKS